MVGVRIAGDLKTYLVAHKGETARVHSVFKDAFNIIDETGNLMTFLTPEKTIGPMSGIVEINRREIKNIHQDDVVEIHEYGLQFVANKREIRFQNAEEWSEGIQGKTRPLDLVERPPRMEALREKIIEQGAMGGIAKLITCLDFDSPGTITLEECPDLNEYAEFIGDRLRDIIQLNLDQDDQGLYRLLPKFTGFGPGLTPSTDDFLLGLMITQIYDNKVNHGDKQKLLVHLDKLYTLCIGRTTKVSEEMLKHGSRGKVADNYRAVVQAMFYDVKPSFEKLVTAAMGTGSSSGTDFLFGVYCMCQLLLKRINEGGNAHDTTGRS